MKCPNIGELYLQDLHVSILNDRGQVEKNPIIVNALYNDCLWKFCRALRFTRRLRVLRYSYVDLIIIFVEEFPLPLRRSIAN